MNECVIKKPSKKRGRPISKGRNKAGLQGFTKERVVLKSQGLRGEGKLDGPKMRSSNYPDVRSDTGRTKRQKSYLGGRRQEGKKLS